MYIIEVHVRSDMVLADPVMGQAKGVGPLQLNFLKSHSDKTIQEGLWGKIWHSAEAGAPTTDTSASKSLPKIKTLG